MIFPWVLCPPSAPRRRPWWSAFRRECGFAGMLPWKHRYLTVLVGFFAGILAFAVAVFYLVYKLLHWDQFSVGNAPLIIGVFLLGALQLFFIGIMGEYILNINTRVINRPIVVEEQRINFDKEEE